MIVVADTGPLVHLYWVDALAWALPPLPVHVVEHVWQEVLRLAPSALGDPRLLRVTASRGRVGVLERFELDLGEQEALCFALAQSDPSGVLVLCDERAARAACAALSIPVTGSLGLVLEAARAGRVTRAAAERALRELPGRGRLHVAPALIQGAVDALPPA